MRPPFSFCQRQKENAPRPGYETKRVWSQLCTSVQSCCTGVDERWCLRVCDDLPTGAAGCGTGLNADSRGAGVKVNGVQGRIWSASLSARSAALRAAGFFAVAKREAAPCGNHPDEVGAIRHGTAATGIAEEHSVPEGQSKSEQAPIRRPPLRAEGHCTGARPSGLFFWTVHGPFSFPQVGKENGGCIPAGQAPCGSRIPVAAGRRPKFPRAVCNLPYTLQGRPYHRAAEGGGPYGCTERIYPRASLRPSR